MATIVGARAAATAQAFDYAGGGILQVAWGHTRVAADPATGDFTDLCKIPANARILGGFLTASDMDTGGTPTFDAEIGDAQGTADPNRYWTLIGQAAVVGLAMSGVAITGNPPFITAEETTVQAKWTTGATFAAGDLTVVIFYVTGDTVV